MEEEMNWGSEVADNVEPDLTQSNEIYNNISKLNDKLDEIAGLKKIDVEANESLEVPFKLETDDIVALNNTDEYGIEPEALPDLNSSMSDELSNNNVASLDGLDISVNDEVLNLEEPILPANNDISNIESNNDVTALSESNIEIKNEINMPTVSKEEVAKDLDTKKEGKGQYILITILTIILISLLLLMVYFTSSL